MKNRILFAAFFIALLQGISCLPTAVKPEPEITGIIDSDDPFIQYIGRFDLSNPKIIAFD